MTANQHPETAPLSALSNVMHECGEDVVKRFAASVAEFNAVIQEHREQWLCEGEGQWPDKFTLLNRYVRTDCEPPFIFND